MSGAAVKLRGFAGGPEPVVIDDGDAGTHALIPLVEPLSVGSPPVAPDLVTAVSVAWPVRAVRARSGWLVTHSLDVAARPQWRVRWTGLTGAQRAELMGWVRDEVGGTLRAWTLDVDAAGSGNEVTVRFVSDPVAAFTATADAGGVFSIDEVTVEEVSS